MRDAILIASFLAAFAAIFAVIFGLAFAWSRYRRARWQAAAEALGLALVPHPHYGGVFLQPFYSKQMVGERAGLPVTIAVRVVIRGAGRNRRRTYYTYVHVDYGRALDLGLTVVAQGFLGRMLDAVIREQDLQLGDPVLDPAYSIHAADPEVARRLLLVPYVREGLEWHRAAPFLPEIHDAFLRVETRGTVFDPVALGRALDGAVDLARRILAARGEVGPSSVEHAITTAWRQVAQARGFTLDVADTKMWGRVDGMHVEVDAQLRQSTYVTQFVVRFDRSLGVGLRLARQGALSGVGKLFGMQDIEVGDPVFDQRFVVKGQPEAAVRAMLTPEVRARLVELQAQATQLEVADDHLLAEVAWLVTDPSVLDAGIQTVAVAGAALAKATPGGVGPYRR